MKNKDSLDLRHIFYQIKDQFSLDKSSSLNETMISARKDLLYLILLIAVIVSFPVIMIGCSEAIMFHQYLTGISYLMFYIPLVLVTLFFNDISYELSIRTLLICTYLLGTINLYIYAINGAAIPIFLTFLVLTTIFLGIKTGFRAVMLSLIPMLIIGAFYVQNVIKPEVELIRIMSNSLSWITAGSVLFFLGSIMIISYGIIQNKMLVNQILAVNQAEELKLLNEKLENDITLLNKTQEELQKSNENFQDVVSSIPTAVWKADITENGDFQNIYISSVADEFMAIPQGSIDNDWSKFISFVQPEYTELVKNAFDKAIISPGIIINCEYKIYKADGQSAWHYSKGKCLMKENRLRIFGTTADITARKNADDELRKYREHLEELVKERTQKLERQKEDLLSMNKVFVGREFRIKELRDEVKELKKKYERRE